MLGTPKKGEPGSSPFFYVALSFFIFSPCLLCQHFHLTCVSHPSDLTVTEGQTATFTVTATGSGTLLYQWKKNGVNVTGGTGGTTASYTTPATVLADSGAQFTCVVSNSVGSVTSNAATLTVNPPHPRFFDFNGDGFGDVIVGAYCDDDGGSYSGCAFVFFGGASPPAVIDASAADLKLVGGDAYDYFGGSVSGGGP